MDRINHGFGDGASPDRDQPFVGHVSLVESLADLLVPGCIAGLFGLPGMGKTSILKRVRDEVSFPVSYVEVRQGDTLAALERRIAEGWVSSIAQRLPLFAQAAEDALKGARGGALIEAHYALRRVLLAGGEQDRSLLGIMLDDIDQLLPRAHDDPATLRPYLKIAEQVRGIMHEVGGITVLVAGIHPSPLRRNFMVDGPGRNPWFQILHERFVPPLGVSECEELLRPREGAGRSVTKEALASIARLGLGHPQWVRQLYALAGPGANGTTPITPSDVQCAVQAITHLPAFSAYFGESGLWGLLRDSRYFEEEDAPLHQRVVRALALAGDTLPVAELLPGERRSLVEPALYRLGDLGLVARSADRATVSLSFGLFGEWVRLHAGGEAASARPGA